MGEGNITSNIGPIDDWQKDNRQYETLRAFTLRKYGLTPATYEVKHAAQNGVCAICGKPETGMREGRPKRLAVDHDNATGHVRDLLCSRCNPALGLMCEDPAILRQAAAYIERHRANVEPVPFVNLPVRGEVA